MLSFARAKFREILKQKTHWIWRKLWVLVPCIISVETTKGTFVHFGILKKINFKVIFFVCVEDMRWIFFQCKGLLFYFIVLVLSVIISIELSHFKINKRLFGKFVFLRNFEINKSFSERSKTFDKAVSHNAA